MDQGPRKHAAKYEDAIIIFFAERSLPGLGRDYGQKAFLLAGYPNQNHGAKLPPVTSAQEDDSFPFLTVTLLRLATI